MKKQDIILKSAIKSFHRKEFASVITQLEPHVFSYRTNSIFWETLGMACLFSDDIGGADTYLQRANQLNEKTENILIALGLIQVRRREPHKAIGFWLECLELFPKSKKAKEALEQLRRHLKNQDLEDWVVSENFKKLIPFKVVFPWAIFGYILLTLTLLFGSFFIFSNLPPSIPEVPREGWVESLLDSNKPILSLEGSFRWVYSENELSALYEKARLEFQEYHDNLARITINRILLSNASSYVRSRAEFLASYIRTPTFYTFSDNFSHNAVNLEPALYNLAFVKWKGALANVVIKPEIITFDLLVGYETRQIVEGIVPVKLDRFAAILSNGENVEVLAQVIVKGNTWYLDLIALRQLNQLIP